MKNNYFILIVILFFCACTSNKSEEKTFVSFRTEDGECFMLKNDSVIPSPYFRVTHLKDGYSIYIEWDYYNELRKRNVPHSSISFKNDFNRCVDEKDMIERLDACVEIIANKYNVDSLQYIFGFVGDFNGIELPFSCNIEKITKENVDSSWYDIYNMAINSTSFKKDMDTMLGKYNLMVDTILIGPDPKTGIRPIGEYLKETKNVPKGRLPHEVVDVGITICVRSYK